MNKRMFLTAAWIGILLLGFISPAQAQEGIQSVTPTEGTVGTEVTILGAGFGEKQGEVQLGNQKCKVLAWGDTQITCEVFKPQPAADYPLTVLLQGDKKPAWPMTFEAFEMKRPRITPGTLVQDGNTVTIEGAFFGDKKGELRLAYRGDGIVVEDAKVVDWSMDTIRFKLPDGLTGRFILKVSNDVGAGLALFDLGGGPPQATPVGYTQVSAGQWNTCAVRVDGVVDCWGRSDYGILTVPEATFKQVAVGSYHACGIKTDDTILCWGTEDGGRISGAPAGKFSQISVGDWHGCAITLPDQYGDVKADCWGIQDGGRINDQDMAKAVNSGNWHNCAIYVDDHIGCWGIEDDNRISGAPDGNFKDVGVGDWHSCAVTTEGTLACWGDNGANRVSPLPDDANDPNAYKQITAGNWHTCALRTGGSIKCWGSNDDQRVTDTPPGSYQQIEAGDRHTCALVPDGTIYCWGNNQYGQEVRTIY